MARYQAAVKTQLLKQEEKLSIQLREADNELKVKDLFIYFETNLSSL
jgi:hypothetical protein